MFHRLFTPGNGGAQSLRRTDGECAKYDACVWLNSLRSCKEVSNRQVGAPVAPREAPRGVEEGATIRRLTRCLSRRKAGGLLPLCAGCKGKRGCLKPWLLATPPAGEGGEGGLVATGDGGAGGGVPRRLSAEAPPFEAALSAAAPPFVPRQSGRDKKPAELFAPAAGSLRN
jgi:hypothetical protein